MVRFLYKMCTFSGVNDKRMTIMKVKFLVMAMMIVGAMCGCTAQGSDQKVEDGCDVFKTSGGMEVKVYCIKHGSLRIQFLDKWIYVDPVTTAVKPETDYSTLPKADYILVTHEHFDHLDSVAINQLTKEGTRIITNARCHELLGGKGLVMENGDVLAQVDLTWRLCPPITTHRRSCNSTPRGVTTALC